MFHISDIWGLNPQPMPDATTSGPWRPDCKFVVSYDPYIWPLHVSAIFVNENENENGEKRENNEFVNEN